MGKKERMKRTVFWIVLLSVIGITMIGGCSSSGNGGKTEVIHTDSSSENAGGISKKSVGNDENAGNDISKGTVKKDGDSVADAEAGTELPLLSKVDTWPEEKEERTPCDTEQAGIAGGYFFIPLDGGIFRYDSYNCSVRAMSDQGISMETDELICTIQEAGITENYIWEIYSLKAYPDKSLLFADCIGNDSILLSYAPGQRVKEGEAEEAQENGFVMMKNGSVISGKEIWQEFCGKAEQGRPAVVKLGYYYTLDGLNMSEEVMEASKYDYPCLFLRQLYYDGNRFTISPVHKLGDEYVIYEKPQFDGPEETYSYLRHYIGMANNTGVRFTAYDKYVLTDDDQVTWEQLERAIFSSDAEDYIRHAEVYCEYTWKKGMER